MRTLAFGALFLGTWMVVSIDRATLPDPGPALTVPAVAPHAAPAAAPDAATLTEVVRQYCVVCHTDQMLTGNLSLMTFDVEKVAENAPVAERMIRKLRAGMMPPPGAPRPSADTLLALVETLESRVDAASGGSSGLGERRFQRLSRAEYQSVIRDLLGLEVDAGRWLPADVFLESFDNMADAQAFSPTLLDAYL